MEQGGGILNRGTLVLDDVIVRNSTADDGGGIYNAGTLTLGKGAFVGPNVASGEGGGIYNGGTLYLCRGTVSGNQAPPGTTDNISGTPAQQCPTTVERCTVTGTSGADRLMGTGGDDVICGRGGEGQLPRGPGDAKSSCR